MPAASVDKEHKIAWTQKKKKKKKAVVFWKRKGNHRGAEHG